MLKKGKLDKSVPIPLYYQLKTLIMDAIKNGEYKSGDMIPTENELSEMYDISRTTIRQAITELVRDGYLYRVKSKGTFVSKPKMALHVSDSYFSVQGDAEQFGSTVHDEILTMEIVPTPQILSDLGVEDEKAIYLYRKRYLDTSPMNRVITYLPLGKFSDLKRSDLENGYLRDIMKAKPETSVAQWARTIEAVQAEKEDEEILDVPAAFPLLKMTTVRYNSDNEVLDVSTAFIRSDMSKIEMNVTV